MSKENSHLKSILETVGVVVGSFIFAMVVIVAATKKDSPEPTPKVVENTMSWPPREKGMQTQMF